MVTSKVLSCNVRYDLEKTLNSGQIFRFFSDQNNMYVIQHSQNSCAVRQLKCTNEHSEILLLAEEDQIEYWECFLRLHDPKALPDISSMLLEHRHPFFREIGEYSNGIQLFRQDVFECTIAFLLSQQNSISRIRSSLIGLANMNDGFGFTPASVVRACSTGRIKDLNLGYRTQYVSAAALQFLNENLESELWALAYAPERLKYRLTEFSGIGDKVSECIMLFAFGVTSVFPVDRWIKRALEEHDVKHQDILDFHNYAGYVQQYMYYYMMKTNNRVPTPSPLII